MKIKKELIMREIAGDVILVPVGKTVIENNGLYILNEVSADIWKMIAAGKDYADIVQALSEDYDADPAQIRADTDEFLHQLEENGILER